MTFLVALLLTVGSAKVQLHACDAAAYPGADAGAKINAAEADPNCTAVDATNLVAPVSAANTIQVMKVLTLGHYTLVVSANPGINIGKSACLTGRGREATIISTNSPTADVIYTNPGNNWACASGFTIESSVPRTAGAGMHIRAGHGAFRDILIRPVWDGILIDEPRSSDLNYFENIMITGSPAGTDGGVWNCGVLHGGVQTATVSGNTFHNLVINADPTSFKDAMMCIADGSDGLAISDSQFVKGHADSVALHLESIAGGNPPEWIKCTACFFEGGLTANGIVVDSALTFDCLNCYVGTSLNGIVLNGGTAFHWDGGQIVNNQQNGIRVFNGIDTRIVNARIGNNSLSENNAYDDIAIGANIKNFDIRGNTFAPVVKSANRPRWNVFIAGGSSNNYSVLDNIMPGSAATGALKDGGSVKARKRVQNF
ncbi:MAG TPA: hypothetical protein VN670_11280 [Acidobacteriaceae bacterium]|nr:hypothetical protein [Acidobacteriaceae bacterium]